MIQKYEPLSSKLLPSDPYQVAFFLWGHKDPWPHQHKLFKEYAPERIQTFLL